MGGLILLNCRAAEDDYWVPVPPGPANSVGKLLAEDHVLIAGGFFDAIGGVTATNIARWDGEKWAPLGDGLAGSVDALALHGTDLHAAGSSRSLGYVSRWDGVRWTALGGEFVSYPRALAFLGNNLFAGGLFRSAGGTLATNIARWDGAQWHSVGGGLRVLEPQCLDCPNGPSPGSYGQVKALAVIGDELFAGGIFDWAGGVRATNVARWDGSQWHALGNGLPAQVESLAVFRQELYAASHTGIFKWNSTNWSGTGNVVATLASDDRYLYAGGSFTEIDGVPANRIARWDGQAWSTLGSALSGSAGDGILAIASNGSEVYVAGSFTKAGNAAVDGFAVWHIPETLKAVRTGGELVVSWPVADAEFRLESTTNLGSGRWSAVTSTAGVFAGRLTVTNTVSDEERRFYRLQK